MPILTPDDRAKYFSTVTLEGVELEGAIASLQALIEGPDGANRPLEVGEAQEIKRLNIAAQTVQLSYNPVLLTPAPVIEARVSTSADWVLLSADEFRIDFNGRLCILSTAPGGIAQRWSRLPHASSRRFSEVQARYWSGLDFSSDTPEINALKASAGQCLTFMTLNHAFEGITSYQAYQEYTVAYGSSSSAGSIPSGLLAPFKKYMPRSFS